MNKMDNQTFRDIWNNVSLFLNQNDLFSLGLVSKQFNSLVANPMLYRSIRITKDPILRSSQCFFDCGITYVSGYRAALKDEDQNDIFLYDRIESLIDSSQLDKIKEIVIEDNVFHDTKEGTKLLTKFIDKLLDIGLVRIVKIKNAELLKSFYSRILELKKVEYLEILNIYSLSQSYVSEKILEKENLQHLKISYVEPLIEVSDFPQDVKKYLNENINKLDLDITDFEISNYRLLQELNSKTFSFKRVKSLRFSHIHQLYDFSDESNAISISCLKNIFCLDKLETLEIIFYCSYTDSCPCVEDFLLDLAPYLRSLKALSLIEREPNQKSSHYKVENWEISLGKFLVSIPNVEKNLKSLCIVHDPSFNGLGEDNVDGNYIRRRVLYDTILTKLKSLEKVSVPKMLQSIAPYEIIMCDLLWNGCTCEFCKVHLPLFDEYLMNHQYLPEKVNQYKDLIPSIFFGYVGEVLSGRFGLNSGDWAIHLLKRAPSLKYWNFHSFQHVDHFSEYSCNFDETCFQDLLKCIVHFFNGYMYHIVQYLPNLRVAMLSGIYYSVKSLGKSDEIIEEYHPDHEHVFTTIVDTSSSRALNCPREYTSLYD